MTFFARTFALSLLLASGLLFAGCASPDLGEACDTVGSTDACVDGAICTNDTVGDVCRKVCVVQEDCPVNYSCNGVRGSSTKSCQPDPI
jgi:hypothetical protein